MSIQGINNANINRLTSQVRIRDGARPAANESATITPRGSAAGKAVGVGAPVSVEPPAGTDPALWSILSGDERAFFAKSGAMGPLTYGRAMRDVKSVQLPAPRGGRFDVKI